MDSLDPTTAVSSQSSSTNDATKQERTKTGDTLKSLEPLNGPDGCALESEPRTFRQLGLNEELCSACEAHGYKMPTPIQRDCIPVALQKRDIVGLAQTGSGKTMAFVLPILNALINSPQPLHSLILSPTRELAQQTCRAVEVIGAAVAVRCSLLIGGMDMVSQAITLAKRPHIVVATPGRLLDHLQNTKGFSMRRLQYLVLDEADRLLDLDFGPVLDKVIKILPPRTTFLFSATMSRKLQALQRAALSNPMRISVQTDTITVSTLRQYYIFLPQKLKDVRLVHLLTEQAGRMTIVFTRTIHEAQRTTFMLRALGFPALPIHGQLSQSARIGAMNKFRAGSRSVLVATDVAARGLDIPNVDIVLNFDLPQDSDTYIHRVGRTARAGKSGMAISFVTQYDVEVWLRIEKSLGRKLSEHRASDEQVMALAESVSKAQRIASEELRAARDEKAAGVNHGKRRRVDRMSEKGNVHKRRRSDADLDEG